jgi:catechol 2,3-dioxygenase-like lactoylglutathione lyase family enzyme
MQRRPGANAVHARSWITVLTLALGASAITTVRAETHATTAVSSTGEDIQAILLRATIVTCRLEESLQFYTEVLGQRVIQQRDFSAEIGQTFIEVSDRGSMRLVILEGRGEYSGGPIMGGRVALLAAVGDPESPACRESTDQARRLGHHGDLILPFRVRGIHEIARRAREGGHRIAFGPAASPMGLSENMLMWDPNGVLLELFEQHVKPLRDPLPGAIETLPPQ